MNILWIQPNQTLALTSIFDESNPLDYAAYLKKTGDIPESWTLAAVNVKWDETGWSHETHRWDGSKIVVSYDAAVEETKARLRLERIPLFETLDVQFMQALESGTPTESIVAEKIRLRNITEIPSGLSLNDLKALTV